MPDASDATAIRLQKVLAQAGLGSRRVCEDLIDDGRVAVNGEVAVLGRRVDPEVDVVEVDGAADRREGRAGPLPAQQAGRRRHHRAATRRVGPPSVELVPAEPRVFPVGRLDADTEGLLLLTNDGDLTHRLTHPSFGVEKEYLAEVEGEPHRGALRRLREGVELDDGLTAPAKVALLDARPAAHHDPRGPQPPGAPHVRRRGPPGACAWCAPASAPLTDRTLTPGEWRALTQDEVRALERAGSSAGAAGTVTVDRSVPAAVRALRGATTVDVDETGARPRAGRSRSLEAMFERNGVDHDDIISILFTATDDLHSHLPGRRRPARSASATSR